MKRRRTSLYSSIKQGKGKLLIENDSQVLNLMQSVEVVYLLFAAPDQEDNENGKHECPQSHDEERKVGHQFGDGQKLLNSCCGCVIYGYTLRCEIQK